MVAQIRLLSVIREKVSSFFCTSTIQTKGNSKKKGKFKGNAKVSHKKLATGGSLAKGKKNDKPCHKAKAKEKKDENEDSSKDKDKKEESCQSQMCTNMDLSSSHLSCEGYGH